MNDRYDDNALLDALGPDERAALEQALAADPATAEALAQWQALRRHLADDLRRDLPDFDLLILYAIGDDRPAALAPEEEARLIAARPDVERALERHPALQDLVRRLRADRAAFDAAWDEVLEPRPAPRQDRARQDRAAVRPPRARRWAWRTSVAVAVVAFATLLVYLAGRDAGFEVVETAANETQEVTLPDGSTVLLAAHSRLMYEGEDDGVRTVRLNGEAIFEVVPGSEPFVVETPAARARVLGTVFGVRADAGTTEVVLASGSVALASRVDAEAEVVLRPGQRSRVVGASAPEQPVAADVAGTLAWSGTWYFQATPLEDVAARLSAHYDIPIIVDDALARDRVGGAYSTDRPAEETLQALAIALDAEVTGDAATGFRLHPRP